jgi:hypothetical protein
LSFDGRGGDCPPWGLNIFIRPAEVNMFPSAMRAPWFNDPTDSSSRFLAGFK